MLKLESVEYDFDNITGTAYAGMSQTADTSSPVIFFSNATNSRFVSDGLNILGLLNEPLSVSINAKVGSNIFVKYGYKQIFPTPTLVATPNP
jgi:hypothetical protein